MSGNVYMITYVSPGNDGRVVTLSIDNSGDISEAIIDVLDYDNALVRFPDIIKISNNAVAVVYLQLSGMPPHSDGCLKTILVDDLGKILGIRDSLVFDDHTGDYTEILHVSGNIYLITEEGGAGDGHAITVEIDDA